ncbi:MAG: hypothetical protein CFH06_00759 [Alphaproteobacteria bacterium MarineAlpha3_Bin5]|nr:GNAT family N-acetyltransferase [Magnetovibrio sp.]PPR78536.1 MAG: hypothetical protein CFH06_00759 [Alphaproteobacteria bacterium MarineAlpha3_Bin5]
MKPTLNHLRQPIGELLENWSPALIPQNSILNGQFCRVEPLNVDSHMSELYEAFTKDSKNKIWTYLPYGPFEGSALFSEWMQNYCLRNDPMFFAIIDNVSSKAVGMASYLRIQSEVGLIEVGHINYSSSLQRTIAGTEAMFLMMQNAFSKLGYRRYEWKCDSLNRRSRRAAERLGFTYEGTFRQATIYKKRNRDTSWYSIIDKEWRALEQAYLEWLSFGNFDSKGKQKVKLSFFIDIYRDKI